MKCQLKPIPHSANAVRVEFDRVIPPLFPKQPGFLGRMMSGENNRILFCSSPTARARHALRVARGNAGKFRFELANPSKVYAELYDRLAGIEGLVEVVDLNRYSMGVEAGGWFTVGEVARQVASVIKESFYSDEDLELGQGFEIPVFGGAPSEGIPLAEEPAVKDIQGEAAPTRRTTSSE